MSIESLPPLREVIKTAGLQPDKNLGQNFLLDLNITDKIIRGAGNLDGETVVEIGPGPGGLTRSLLGAGVKKIYAIEYDPRAIKALQPLVEYAQGRLELIHVDALQFNPFHELQDERFSIFGNLPYNIATPLLFGWLEELAKNPERIGRMVLMFQKEVGDRILADETAKAYGRLAVMCGWLCHTSRLFDLPPSVFTPPPKIFSSVIHFQPKSHEQAQPPFEVMEKVVKAAFSQRRKMVRSTLKSYTQYFEVSGINPQHRAEQLCIADFVRLSKACEA